MHGLRIVRRKMPYDGRGRIQCRDWQRKAIYKYFAQGIPSVFTSMRPTAASSDRAKSAACARRPAWPRQSISSKKTRWSKLKPGRSLWLPAMTFSTPRLFPNMVMGGSQTSLRHRIRAAPQCVGANRRPPRPPLRACPGRRDRTARKRDQEAFRTRKAARGKTGENLGRSRRAGRISYEARGRSRGHEQEKGRRYDRQKARFHPVRGIAGFPVQPVLLLLLLHALGEGGDDRKRA